MHLQEYYPVTAAGGKLVEAHATARQTFKAKSSNHLVETH